jgi:branched-chain amino acid transport system substrate-binding protein
MRRRNFLSSSAAIAAIAHTTSYATTQDRVIGLSLPRTGNQAAVASDFEMGYRLSLLAANSPFKIRVLDDFGEAKRTAENVKILADDPSVIALTGIVGTPHAELALPIATAAGLGVFGIRSGASSLRDGRSGVIHMRSSYEEELDKIASMCAGAGLSSVSIIHSNDSFGKSTRTYLAAALEKRRIATFAPISIERNGSDMLQATTKCAKSLGVSGQYAGVVLLMISDPMLNASKELRLTHKIALPIFAMSFVATRAISSQPIPYLTGLGLVSAFPIPQTSVSEVSRRFRKDCEKFGLTEISASLTSFEGWFYGSAIARTEATTRPQVLQRMLAGVTVADQKILPDSMMVAYRHTEIVRKSDDGKLKS